MQTAAISYRVVDFLKQHAPFHGIEEPDLLALVSRGRVKFHEIDEFLCWQNTSYAPLLFVIQQGSVSVWEEVAGKELLRDIRGPGDMIGLERFLGSQAYPYSAKTNGDVVVYAVQAADFEPLLAKYPHVARYVEAHLTAGAIYGGTSRAGVHEMFVVELARHPEPLSCGPDCTVAEAARIMRGANASAVAVMQDNVICGVLTAGGVVSWVADGGRQSQTVKEIMSPAPAAVGPASFVTDCVLAMSQSRSSVVALTADGTLNGGLLRLLSAEDLQPAFGDNPAAILDEISHASGLEVLRVVHLRARAFMREHLLEPSSVDWLSAFGNRLNILIVKRLAELAGNAGQQWCWCFWGAAGRCELLTAVEPEIALICQHESDAGDGSRALERLRADLAECGYLPYETPDWSGMPLCTTEAEWKDRFAQWIHQPVTSGMYEARPLFDLRPAFGNEDSWRELARFLREAIAAEPAFQLILANDCLSALPPLTFFQDAVIEESGERAESLALAQRAIRPVVEVARVFGLTSGNILGSSTLERLDLVRSQKPENEKIFREASQNLRVLLYLQARSGLRHDNSGDELQPSQLSRFDRQALKSGFRSIHNLLEFTVHQLLGGAR